MAAPARGALTATPDFAEPDALRRGAVKLPTMGEHRPSRRLGTVRPSWFAWDNYLIGVIGLAFAVAFGTAAAILAEAGHYPPALAVAAFALLFAAPAAVQAIGELLAGLMLVGMLLGAIVLLPALLLSPTVRRWAKRRWVRATA